MIAKILLPLLGGLSLLTWGVQAASITIKVPGELSGEQFSIEAGVEVLADGELEDEPHTIDVDPLLEETVTKIPARLTIDGHREFALGINLFRCKTGCKWQVVMGDLAATTSTMVENICKQNQQTIEGLYERYFFCRQAYMGHLAAGGTCWLEARQALSGWFDAAYQLHMRTLKEGTAFVARDRDVEAYVRDAQLACKGFEGSVRKSGYFAGMFRQLDKALLQGTQRVEKLLVANDAQAAKQWAEAIVQEFETEQGLRDSLPKEEVTYIEAILNRALNVDPQYTLP